MGSRYATSSQKAYFPRGRRYLANITRRVQQKGRLVDYRPLGWKLSPNSKLRGQGSKRGGRLLKPAS